MALENFEKEISIKKKLLQVMSQSEIDKRYLFANEEPDAITDFSELKQRDPEVAADYLRCIQENPNREILIHFDNGALKANHKLLITYYPELTPVKYPISNFEIEFIRESLRMLHSAGISHGDVHPNNVMFNNETGTIVLIDWDGSTLIANQDRFENDMHFLHNNLRDYNEKVKRDIKRQEERQKRKLQQNEEEAQEDSDNMPQVKRERLDF
jgi:thiamine kinase-like enzyme